MESADDLEADLILCICSEAEAFEDPPVPKSRELVSSPYVAQDPIVEVYGAHQYQSACLLLSSSSVASFRSRRATG